jgi:tetratricopeptide (TPR) repeat protein
MGMSEQLLNRAEELRREALARHRAGEIEEALEIYDHALALADDEEERELITINKADAMIALEKSGPEVLALAAIVMRRRKPHHTFLAAYALQYKYRIAGDPKRAIFYGNIANDVANEADDAFWRVAALNELGVVLEIDSQFDKAIECFQSALAIVDSVANQDEQTFCRVAIVANLGYNTIITGETDEGIRLMESVLDAVQGDNARSDALIDLCYGYIDRGDYERALRYGEEGLALATDSRQVRNGHYLLGEVAYKSGDLARAEFHFDKLSAFYPDFRHLKSLLFAIDLRSMVNLKL